jgi:N-acetylmuramic acid 6-phosphate (MurNAc-6-P) etherase
MGAPITETPNELTVDIDIAEPKGIVRLLRQTDSQIFNGYSIYPGLSDTEILKKIECAIEKTAMVMKAKGKKAIVISGAGTSGRLAFFIARTFNRILAQSGHPPIFYYLMAGGDKALIRAQEGAEDNPKQAVLDLESVIHDAKQVAYFGVTCGLSAPYIAGQLDYSANKKHIYSVLLGFNPAALARNVPIENWDKTFLDVVQKIQKKENCLILNPIIGPEPITGSTRMKSGSATKIILELIFALALEKSGLLRQIRNKKSQISNLKSKIQYHIQQYETTRVETYQELEPISELVRLAGNSLRNKGHIYYLGSAPYGILGIIDASECPPTFGADFEDVRGFIEQGWKGMLGAGRDLSSVGPQYRIGIEEFVTAKLPKLSKHDLILFLGEKNIPAFFRQLLAKSSERGAHTGVILINGNLKKFAGIDVFVQPDLSHLNLFGNHKAFAEVAMKFILNALTTGGHILAGKVYQNRMIDLKISNNKLYYRTINIISDIMGVSKPVATESMLKSIYATDRLTKEQKTLPISAHIVAATGKIKVVPKAMLLATGKFNLSQASAALKKEPIVRNIIKEHI